MEKFKGTKEKWEVKSFHGNNVIVSSDTDNIINISNNNHNAKLIASAPEMFEILTELQSYFKSLDDYNDAEIMLSYKIKELLTKITE